MESFLGFNTNYQGPYTMVNTSENMCVAKEVGQHMIIGPEVVAQIEEQQDKVHSL